MSATDIVINELEARVRELEAERDHALRAAPAEHERHLITMAERDDYKAQAKEYWDIGLRREQERDAARMDAAKTGEREAVSLSRIQYLMAENERLRALLRDIRPYVYGIDNIKRIDAALKKTP